MRPFLLLAAAIAVAMAVGFVVWRDGRRVPAPVAAPRAPLPPVIEPLPPPSRGFEGQWAGACSVTTKCGRDPQSVDEDRFDLRVTRRGNVLDVASGACLYRFRVHGLQAALVTGQRCAAETEPVEAWTLTLAPGGDELTVAQTSRPEAAPGIVCTARRRGVLSRR